MATTKHYLPLFAQAAIERLESASELRTASSLDFLLDAYARTYGLECDCHTRSSAHHICTWRFAASFTPFQTESVNEVRVIHP